MEFAVEEFTSQFCGLLRVLVLQLLDQAVHLHLRQEINDVLSVLKTEIGKLIGRGTLYGQHDLIDGILVAREFHRSLRVDLLVDIHDDDVAEDVEHMIEMLWVNLRDME